MNAAAAKQQKKAKGRRVTFPMPKRVVVVGDLNGDDEALAALLRGTGLTDAQGHWAADNAHLVQLGDVVNRGIGCRSALDRLIQLSAEAPPRNSHVTMLLGNHEAMVLLGNHAWCHPEEFLEFATAEERNHFEVARTRRVYELLEMRSHGGRTAPITGALRAWEEAHVPGREAYVAAFSEDGVYGSYLRSLPAAIRIGDVLFVHGGLTPRFAERGLKKLDEQVVGGWARAPQTALDLTQDSPLAAEDGPLWCRSYAAAPEEDIDDDLDKALEAVSASVMVVGHTRTDLIGGKRGHPLVKHSGRLICADVGIGSSGGTPAALVIEKDVIWSWRPDEKKKRLRALDG
jgi:hypothetical protein